MYYRSTTATATVAAPHHNGRLWNHRKQPFYVVQTATRHVGHVHHQHEQSACASEAVVTSSHRKV